LIKPIQNWTQKTFLIIFIAFIMFAVAAVKMLVYPNLKIGVSAYSNSAISCIDEPFYIVDKQESENSFNVGEGITFTAKEDLVELFNSFLKDESKKRQSYEMLKIIAAKAGDTVKIKDSKVFINEQHFPQMDIDYFTKQRMEKNGMSKFLKEFEITLKDGELFVVGNNYDFSFDSRYWGVINESQVSGRVIYPSLEL
jgi:signal peptidase I